ncbi:NADH-quinone oxidoreductase subunit L [Oceanidesulfovibrio marinus]|uniref:NADH-quinone oxidoreductase subunit L n=1 Tax=Oceanidesulfovibrio marinus TaxID=370038 RepID=A0A6P1ZK78_9BACT|nr:NADH-quinone oxidoreductase subunit L [Oceanidesulfovibrio marinus]TVM33757.1 NADH-quinone oxidoreductase subunit L [Oceanidesulfovibrio marinus]
MTVFICLILFTPLLGATLLALAGRAMSRRLSGVLACLCVAGSLAGAIAGWSALAESGSTTQTIHLFTWFSVAGLNASFSALYNHLAAVMATMVAFVSLIIHVHSYFFMRDDESWVRYFCYLNLFVFFMQVIVLADNLIFLFMGWEGVGFCSFALIGFWYTDPSRVMAGRKAFLVTRVGDVAFIAAMAVLFYATNSLGIADILGATGTLAPATVTLVGLLFLWAAAGKSAQLPLLVWLPDAMAGPSPVSALIHAATMVTAGVYLLIRLFPMLVLSTLTMEVIAALGALTALFAACAALAQHDIKRVLAWSTISQVGYMVIGVGIGDPNGSFFHLLVHAFFKSLLFMVAGIVIQALHEEHDIFKMGARVRKIAPGTALAFFCGAAALAGLPPFAGFFSKGTILEHALTSAVHGPPIWMAVWAAGTVTALLTALYSFRVFFLAFTGKPALEPDTKTEKTPPAMLHVLWPLALLSVVAGALNMPEHVAMQLGIPPHWLDHVLGNLAGPVMEHPDQHLASMAELIDGSLALVGFAIALFIYGPWRIRKPAADKGLAAAMQRGFGLDYLYMTYVARPYRAAADLIWKNVEDGGVDSAALGLGGIAVRAGNRARRWGEDKLTSYLLWLLLGLVIMLVIVAAVGIR